MAVACKCDRCGIFFLPNQCGRMKRLKIADVMIGDRIENSMNVKSYDLCNECADKFNVWVHKYDDLKEDLKNEN